MDPREDVSHAAANEVLLTAQQLSVDFRQLRRGDLINVGDLFQEPHNVRKMTPDGMKFRFLRVVSDTFVNDVEIAGIAWDPSYPLVVRELPKLDLFSQLGEDAPTIFCRASKDLIRGELIAIRVGPNSTLLSDKLDFTRFNASRTRSIALMKAPGGAEASR